MNEHDDGTRRGVQHDARRRRALHGLAGTAVLGAGAALGRRAAAETPAPAVPRTLRLASSWPADLPVFGESMRLFAELVDQLTGGAVRIDVVSPDRHGQPLATFDLVRSGTFDIAHTASYYHIATEPDAMYLTTMPFGMIASELSAFYRHGGGMRLLDELYGRHGIEAIPGGNTGMQMGGWFRERIDTVKDLRGLTMRVPGAGGRVLRKLGVQTVTLPAEALYDALLSGELDAVEFVGPAVDLGLGLHRIAPYYYTGWQEPGSEMFFLFDAIRLAELSPPHASALRLAAELTGTRFTSAFNHANAESWARVKLEYPDIRVTSFPVEVIDELRLAHEAVMSEERARSAFASKALDAMTAYVRSARRWTEMGDWSYLANASR